MWLPSYPVLCLRLEQFWKYNGTAAECVRPACVCPLVLSRLVLCVAGGGKVSVAKVQVGLLGSARSLKRDLDRIAGRADTNTPEGLHYVMQGELLSLLVA